ncbi:MAG: magnetochrome domain-containing protein [Candidatus Omnitrophica bacterium]|nr:magnetochrome domain-containing protein [Candidatus Omnitrophota bacterium]
MVTRTHVKKHNPSLEEISAKIKNADLNTYFIFGAILIVLIAGVYALFAPETTNEPVGNPACGKIVVATDGSTLASKVSSTLPEARYFLVVNPLTKRLVESIKNPYQGKVPNPQIAYLIAGKGEEAVIVGSIDQESYNIFNQFSIRVFGGYRGQAKQVISLYRKARIGQMARPTMSAPQNVKGHAQVAFQGLTNFVCPRCGQTANGQNYRGAGCPICPNCAIQMMQQNTLPQRPMLGRQNALGMRINQPYCPIPNAQNSQNVPMQNQVGTQSGVQAGAVIQDIYSKGVMDGLSMKNNFAGGLQAAFGFGQQAFVCPVCNWRMKASKQGNNFPACPNCGSPMALDMSKQNQEPQGPFAEGVFAANTVPAVQPAYPMNNQANNQMNINQGNELTQAFQCPNCNWRMYAKQGANEFPQCPNCGQIMARAGNAFQKQNTQNGAFANNGNFAAQIALPQNNQAAAGTTTVAPPIFRNAVMPHEYRGVCENCHIIRADIAIPANAQMPHPYRGICSNCHQILGTGAGVQNNNQIAVQPNDPAMMQNDPTTQNQFQNNTAPDQGVAHVGIK